MDLLNRKPLSSWFNKKGSHKCSAKKQQEFIQLLADLLNNGFTLQESIYFMRKAAVFSETFVQTIINELEKGSSLNESLQVLGFGQQLLLQIQYAESHGNLIDTLYHILSHLKQLNKQKHLLQKILVYPALLLGFLFSMILAIRQFVLPQLLNNASISEESISILLIQNSPVYLLTSCLFFVVLFFVFNYLRRRKSALQQAEIFVQLPVIGKFYQLYLSAFCALEWGKLFVQGLETKEVLEIMKSSLSHSLMKELSESLFTRLLEGEQLYQQVQQHRFFTKELGIILQHGEMKGNVGKELMLYSQICWEQYFEKMSKKIQWIQPFVFLVIALLIVGIYAALLLPVYSNMEGFL